MDIHHNTSVRSLLEDDSISLAFKACICSCLGKGVGLWFITRPSIHSFHIARSTFTSTLHFHLSLIQPLTFSFLTCDYGHGLDTFDMHIVCCPFGQWMTIFEMSCMPSLEKVGMMYGGNMVHLYIMSFITSQFLHDPKRLGFCCQCGGYWFDTKDCDFECN
jgi:hypothetical protein